MWAKAVLHHFSQLETVISVTLKPRIQVLKFFVVREVSKDNPIHTMPLSSH